VVAGFFSARARRRGSTSQVANRSLALRIAPLARALTWGRLFPCYLGHPAPAIHAARALAALLETDPLGQD
jgi:hypothetical protein